MRGREGERGDLQYRFPSRRAAVVTVSQNFADRRGTGLISFTIRPRHLWSLPVNYALSTVPFINIALGGEFTLSTPRSHVEERTHLCTYVCMYLPTYHLFYALSRSSSELLINCQWELSKVERTGDTQPKTLQILSGEVISIARLANLN